ncbi:hypothetical protein XELAEV_18032920mg [Xenopus laevis]|uniref:Uncharacterized protein n=1 Tax=Xenopus laevis TaxID=8355 RepID=A0A974CIL3_XENLA|nr:hypothetical protein XELAEV_18032920mg [Xenopus laevis]
MYLIWWLCPLVQRFWIRIYNKIYSIFNIPIPKHPCTALLCKKPDTLTSNQFQLFLLIVAAMTAAKQTIAKAWKTKHISIEDTKGKIDWIMVQEKMSSILLGSHQKYLLVWTPWIEYRFGTNDPITFLSI